MWSLSPSAAPSWVKMAAATAGARVAPEKTTSVRARTPSTTPPKTRSPSLQPLSGGKSPAIAGGGVLHGSPTTLLRSLTPTRCVSTTSTSRVGQMRCSSGAHDHQRVPAKPGTARVRHSTALLQLHLREAPLSDSLNIVSNHGAPHPPGPPALGCACSP